MDYEPEIESDAWMIAQGFRETTPEEDLKYRDHLRNHPAGVPARQLSPEQVEIVDGLVGAILYPQDTEGSRVVAEAIAKYENLTNEESQYLLDVAMKIIHHIDDEEKKLQKAMKRALKDFFSPKQKKHSMEKGDSNKGLR